MGLMDGKVCVITGAAGSLGLASAKLLHSEGAKVMLVDLHQDKLDVAAAGFSSGADRVATCPADVSKTADVETYLSSAVERFGPIDVLFSNAGLSGANSPITDFPEDDFDRVMAVNVKGSFLALKHGLPKINDGGSVILTSSVMGVTTSPGIVAYTASKHALIGMAGTVSKEVAGRNIRVNVLAPGPIDNQFQLDIEKRIKLPGGADATAMINQRIPMGRHAQPEEVAGTVLYLASSLSSFSTGGVYMSDGGFTA